MKSPTKSAGAGEASRMCSFRFTAAEALAIGQIANAVERKTGLPVSKTDVMRAGIRLMKEKWLKAAGK